MISLSLFCGILAAACLIPSLYRGAVQDLREFRFSASHFDSLWINAATVSTILMYFFILADGLWLIVFEFFLLSLISWLIFGFIGFRYGGGGDWRALSYIAWIAPFLLVNAIFAIGICACAQAIYWVFRKDIATPPMFRKIPFAVSIFCGYVIALVLFIMSAGVP